MVLLQLTQSTYLLASGGIFWVPLPTTARGLFCFPKKNRGSLSFKPKQQFGHVWPGWTTGKMTFMGSRPFDELLVSFLFPPPTRGEKTAYFTRKTRYICPNDIVLRQPFSGQNVPYLVIACFIRGHGIQIVMNVFSFGVTASKLLWMSFHSGSRHPNCYECLWHHCLPVQKGMKFSIAIIFQGFLLCPWGRLVKKTYLPQRLVSVAWRLAIYELHIPQVLWGLPRPNPPGSFVVVLLLASLWLFRFSFGGRGNTRQVNWKGWPSLIRNSGVWPNIQWKGFPPHFTQFHSSMVEFSVHGGNLSKTTTPCFPQTPKYPSYQQYVSAWPWCVLQFQSPKCPKKP